MLNIKENSTTNLIWKHKKEWKIDAFNTYHIKADLNLLIFNNIN